MNNKKTLLKYIFSKIFLGILFAAYFLIGGQKISGTMEDWKVILFGGPGKGDEIIASVTSDNSNGGINKIYGLASKTILVEGQRFPDVENCLYEFFWTGESWERKVTPLYREGFIMRSIRMGFYNARNDGIKRLYYGTPNGSVFELTFNGRSWIKENELRNETQTLEFYGFSIEQARDNKYRIYKSSPNNQLEEYTWNGSSWTLIAQNISEDFSENGNYTYYNWILNISSGNGRGDTMKNYLYVKYWYDRIEELEWAGESWNIVSRIDSFSDETEGQTRSNFLIADLGRGTRIYNLSAGIIYECSWDKDNWKEKQISNANISAITYGKISWEESDPAAIYALIAKNLSMGEVGGEYSEENADEIHEYTFNKNANKGKGKWQKTWDVKLFDSSIPRTRISGWWNTVDLCMINGRNEKVIVNGTEIDKYQRLYIVDSWGNMWECSIPPRKERPDYKVEDTERTTPDIMGTSKKH